MKITSRNCLGIAIYFLIFLFIINNIYFVENFKDSLDEVDGMNKKMDDMTEMEEETRMFCKLLRHDEDRVQLQELLNSRNQQFQDNWKKQNKIISDIKKKFIKLRLEKDGRNLVEYNSNKNKKSEEMKKRKVVLEKAKEVAESPYNLSVNINNNS